LRIVRLRDRARIVDGEDVLSEILDHAGPTDTMFDVLAACIAALAPGPRVALLGFAGGGLVAPLRAMGFTTPLLAVDISLAGLALFDELSGDWAGRVDVVEAEAGVWLRRTRRRFDLILEDLSVPSPQDAVKPVVSLDTLPELMQQRLRPGGIAITNVLPVPGTAWTALLEHLAQPFPRAVVIHFDHYVNRILVAGNLPSAAEVARALRAALARIGSLQTHRFSVRRLGHSVSPAPRARARARATSSRG